MRLRPLALACAAICLAAGTAYAGGPTPPDPPRIEQARVHMKAGAAFYNDPSGHKCEEAIREFRTAYELSGSLNALKAMAICNFELERDGDAITQYETYLKGKGTGIDPAERAQVESDLNELRTAAAGVTLAADREGVRITDVRTPAKGYPIRNTYTIPAAGKRFGIHPGQHVFTASVEGRPDQVWKVEIVNGSSYAHTFSFPADQPSPVTTTRPVPTSVFVGFGLTAALAVPWVVLAVRAKNLGDEYKTENGHQPGGKLEDLRSDVKTANLLADVFLGAAVASLTVTMVLLFTRPSRPVPQLTMGSSVLAGTGTVRRFPPGEPQSPGLMLSPAAGVRGGGAVISGWF